MIILKLLVCVIIVLICTYLGIEKANDYGKRVLELKRIKSGLQFFKSKIEFTYEPIKDIFEGISKSVYNDDVNVFQKAKEYMAKELISDSWNKAVEEESKIGQEDKDVLKMFGKLLGKTDKNGQISEVNLSLDFIDRQIEKAESEKSKNAKLYQSLGIIIGVGLVIILW